MAQFQIYICEEASQNQRCMAVTITKGERLPVVYYAATPEEARANAERGWEADLAKAEKVRGGPRKKKAQDVAVEASPAAEEETIEEAI